ncbi:VOC family protein [Lysobacter alkalisoli]|uniref:VOC family protein n=2 Tax=Marilutibacter alkalisoli TaxID=2591633 RepID=A0A514BWZ2_9GAMM|nr:VOC family protein [Lysobacter alkalisoli]
MLARCRITTIVFLVADLTRTIEFYGRTLGLPVQTIDGHDGPFATCDTATVSLVFIVAEAKAGDSPVVVFELEGGIDDYADRLAERGVEIVVPVSEAPDGGLTLDFVDPDRNTLSLYQPPGSPRRR